MNIIKKKLSIVIVTYNRPNEVIRAIKSCLPLDEKITDFVVWDNNSNRYNSEVVRNFCDQQSFPIRYYYSEKNLGPGGGKNAGWLLCDSEYVFIMDDDAIIGTSGFFDKIIMYMDNHKEAGAAYVSIDEPSTGHRYNCEYRKVYGNVVKTLAYVGGGHIIRKKSFPQKNLYPYEFMFGSEELYASLIVWDNHQEVHEINDLQVLHLPTASNRILGKERDMKIIISGYIVKKMLYPVYCVPLCYILFYLKRLKHLLSRRECKQLLDKYAFLKAENRIGIKTIIKLSKEFGILNMF